MPDEYRCWSKNPFVSSNNGTSNWWIFENFPNDVKMWNDIIVDVGQQKFLFFLRAISQIEMVFDNHLKFRNASDKKVSISVFESFKYIETPNNCRLHLLIMLDLSAFAGPNFLSVSLMTWILFKKISVTNL